MATRQPGGSSSVTSRLCQLVPLQELLRITAAFRCVGLIGDLQTWNAAGHLLPAVPSANRYCDIVPSLTSYYHVALQFPV
jgi:hypothetical protein